jgi:predicted DNA-binding transcriptional regulator YafY
MPRCGMQQSRLLSILLRLQTQGRVSAKALSETFEVSIRTIYRDIDQLSAAGVPVYAETGRNGGFQLLDGYRTKLTGLDRPEAESLFLAGLPFAAEQLGMGLALDTTRMKLLAALPEAMRADAEKVTKRFHADPVAWFQDAEEHRRLPDLAAAVWAGRQLQLRYDSWEKVVDRRVSPLGLVLKGGIWYLVAAVEASSSPPNAKRSGGAPSEGREGGNPRTYRVASILDMTVLDAPAVLPPKFDLKRYWKTFARDYETRMQSGTARIRARQPALKELARLSAAMSRAVRDAGPVDQNGWRALDIPIESVPAATRDLLRFGAQVQALGPPELVRAMRAAVHDLAMLYPPAKR